MTKVVSIKQLLEAGVHFGHTTKRWDPRMKPYIFTSRNGIYIIDLKITAEKINEAYQKMLEIVQEGGRVLFIGTKKQAQEVVREVAERTNQFYVDQRWLGGTLTNFKTIRRSIKLLKELYKMEEDGVFEKLPKKEVLQLQKKRAKLEKNLSGIKEMQKVPEAIFIVDPRKEINAIREARKLQIPVFGIVDTNCNPDDVDYIIPANDDAIRAVKLIVDLMGDAIIEGQGGVVEHLVEEEDIEQDIEVIEKPKKPVKKATKVEPKMKEEVEVKKAAEPKKATKKATPTKAKETDLSNQAVEGLDLSEKNLGAIADDLSLKTVPELREEAKNRGLTGYSKLRKAELIELLKQN